MHDMIPLSRLGRNCFPPLLFFRKEIGLRSVGKNYDLCMEARFCSRILGSF